MPRMRASHGGPNCTHARHGSRTSHCVVVHAAKINFRVFFAIYRPLRCSFALILTHGIQTFNFLSQMHSGNTGCASGWRGDSCHPVPSILPYPRLSPVVRMTMVCALLLLSTLVRQTYIRLKVLGYVTCQHCSVR